VTDSNCAAIEADPHYRSWPRGAVTPDKRLGKIGAVAGESAGERDIWSNRSDYPVDEFTAVDVQTIRKHKYAGEIFSLQSSTDGFTTIAGLLRIADVLAHQLQPCCIKTDRRCDDFIIADITIVDLAAGAATQDMRRREHLA
jgi:hypothetical protein